MGNPNITETERRQAFLQDLIALFSLYGLAVVPLGDDGDVSLVNPMAVVPNAGVWEHYYKIRTIVCDPERGGPEDS